MNFDYTVRNKSTEFTARRGDDTCIVRYDYDIEGMEEVIKAFETILTFFTYNEGALKDYYRDEIIDEYLQELKDKDEDQ